MSIGHFCLSNRRIELYIGHFCFVQARMAVTTRMLRALETHRVRDNMLLSFKVNIRNNGVKA